MAKKFYIIFLLNISLFFTTANAFVFHPFYISVTEMVYNEKTRSVEISCKMFAEDVEDILKQNYKIPVDLSNEQMQAKNRQIITDYLTRNLSLNIDSKPLAFKFIGFEKEKESVYCYLEVTNVPSIKKLAITNSILYDYKKEQINIIHVTIDGNRLSTKLDYPKNHASFNF